MKRNLGKCLSSTLYQFGLNYSGRKSKKKCLGIHERGFFIHENYYVNFWLKERTTNKYSSCRKMGTQ